MYRSSATVKGKAVANAKAKAMSAAVASSSRHDDEDVEMLDAECMQDEPDEKVEPEVAVPAVPEDGADEHDEDDDHDEGDEDEDEGNLVGGDRPGRDTPTCALATTMTFDMLGRCLIAADRARGTYL